MSVKHHHKFKHGHASCGKRSKTYKSWESMIARCYRPGHDTFHIYGGAGIKVCKRWRTFENFLADMGERPDGMTIDRIDSTGDYEPSNCRWANAETQQNNRSNVLKLEFGGLTMSPAQWARRIGTITRHQIYGRLRLGWSAEKALTTPICLSKSHPKIV
jgi:hypothetical protein